MPSVFQCPHLTNGGRQSTHLDNLLKFIDKGRTRDLDAFVRQLLTRPVHQLHIDARFEICGTR